MELRRYAAYGFLGGVVGAAAVVFCSFVLHYSGIGPRFGADSAITLASPDIYRPLFWRAGCGGYRSG